MASASFCCRGPFAHVVSTSVQYSTDAWLLQKQPPGFQQSAEADVGGIWARHVESR